MLIEVQTIGARIAALSADAANIRNSKAVRNAAINQVRLLRAKLATAQG